MLLLATQLAVIATGLVAGVFLTFSDFVMRSLAASEAIAGAEAMQEINRKVYGSIFLTLFLGMTAGSAGLIGAGLLTGGPAAPWLIGGGAIYLSCVFGVTVLGNVPMNQRLDALPPADKTTLDYWGEYAVRWTRLNHVRTIGSAAAAIAFLIAAQRL